MRPLYLLFRATFLRFVHAIAIRLALLVQGYFRMRGALFLTARLCFPQHFYCVCEVIYGDRESFRGVCRRQSRRATSHLRILQQRGGGAQGASLVLQKWLRPGG